jgi:multiple sugar transport system substrate-binding protein
MAAPGGGLNRRHFLGGAAALGAAGLLGVTTLGSPFGRGEKTVSFWHLFSGGDGERLASMLDDFAAAGTGIDVEPLTLYWGPPYYTKLALAAAGNRPPDVAAFHASRLGAYAPQGLLTPLEPELLARHGITEDKFLPEVWKRGQFEGRQYLIPLDTHPLVLYYNTDLAKKADLMDGDRLRELNSAEDLLGAFEAMKRTTGKQGVSFEVRGVMLWRIWTTFYGQLGGRPMFTPDGTQLTLDDDKAEEAVAFMTEFTQGRKVAAADLDYAANVAFFQNGTTGFMLNGAWEVPTLNDAKMPYDIAPIPPVLGRAANWADSHSFAIPASTTRTPERMDAALTFVAGMLERGQMWAEGGHVPAFQPVVRSTAYQRLEPQSHYVQAAENAVYGPTVWFGGAGSELENEAFAAFQSSLTGSSDPRGAVRQFRAAMEEFLDKPSPVVSS